MFTSNFVKHSTLAAGISSLIGLSSLFGASPSYAAPLVNGSFEDGFTEYMTTGDTSIQDSSFGSGPTDGMLQALLTTLPGTEPIPGNEPFTFSGNPAVPAPDLEDFLSLPDGTLPLNNIDAFEGSSVKQSFMAMAGDTLSFDFNFLTDEDAPNGFEDVAFVAPIEQATGTAFVVIIGDIQQVFDLSATPFNQETGYQTFSQPLLPSVGNQYTVGFVVVDVTDGAFDSALLVDNIRVGAGGGNGGGQPVPEPSTTLGLLAFGTLGGRLLYKRKQLIN